MSHRPIARFFVAATTLAALTGSAIAWADTTVQIPLTGVLDARSVWTLTAGQLVVFTLPTDGGNLQNAFATKAVAMKQGKPPENALPDDGKFAADTRHPDVVLHFSNDADAASPQTHLIKTGDMMMFPVPPATYSKLFLFFNGAAGGTTITVTLNYADGMEMKKALIPDYYADPTDPAVFTLAGNLAKYDKNAAINEANHHNIHGAEFAPMAGKMLNSVQVTKDAMGNLVFWGATGIATSPVDVGGAGGAGGAAGAGGSAGVGGSVGGGGGAGTSGGGTAGSPAAGGSGGGVLPSAGASGAGISGGAGGNSAAGTNTGTAGSAVVAAGTSSITPSTPASDAGCGCRIGAATNSPRAAFWLLLGAGSILRLRRQRRRQAR